MSAADAQPGENVEDECSGKKGVELSEVIKDRGRTNFSPLVHRLHKVPGLRDGIDGNLGFSPLSFVTNQRCKSRHADD